MAKLRINPQLRVMLALMAILTGAAAPSAYAETDWCWYTTKPLPPPSRNEHTATLVKLADGTSAVLVVGGWYKKEQKPLPTIELIKDSYIYKWGQTMWAPAPNCQLQTGRVGNTTTRLEDGTVLVAGGYQISDGKNTSIKDCELLDPAKEQGNPGNSAPILLNEARDHHTATLLSVKNQPNYGKVLVVGGRYYNNTTSPESVVKTSELYDPANKSWEPPVTLTTARAGHTATLLPDGRVLVTGGHMLDSSGWPPAPYWTAISDCEIWNPSSKTWSTVNHLNHARAFHTATLLSDDPQDQNYGKVLVAGGCPNVFDAASLMYSLQLNSYEIYDPAKDTWTCPTDQDANDHLQRKRVCHTATRLNDGTVLVVGSASDTYSSEVYGPDPQDPGKPWQWTYTTSLWYPRAGNLPGFTTTLLDNQDGWVLLVAGGPDICELFTPPKLILPAGVAAPVNPPGPGN